MKLSTLKKNRSIALHTAPAELKRQFVDGNREKAIQKLSEALERGEPWVLSKWLEAAGVIGQQQMIQVNLYNSLGVDSQEELIELIQKGRKIQRLEGDQETSLEEYQESAIELLQMVWNEHPEWKEKALKRLSSGVVMPSRNGTDTD
jgi:hypothetical protein